MRTIYKCFPGGKFKALTMSYDDGRVGDVRLVNLFNKYGIKGTFHLNAGLLNTENDASGRRLDKDEIVKLYRGHEVSAHTYTHSMIERYPITQVINEIVEDRRGLEEILNYPVRGMSYPYGSFNDGIKDILPKLGIEYSRVVDETGTFDMPNDFLEWKGTCHHNHNLLELTDKFISIDRAKCLYLFYVWGHSYEFDRDNNWDIIEEFCCKVSNKKDVWYATNIEIVDYMKAFDRLNFSMDGSFVYNPSVQSVWISVDNEIYEIKGGEQVNFDN